MVRATYAIAWTYVLGDVSYNGYKAHQATGGDVEEVAWTMAHSFVFQSVASIGLPMVIIHTVVHQAARGFHAVGKYQRWGPSICGLALIPLLPLIDEPIEHVIDGAFAAVRGKAEVNASSGGAHGDSGVSGGDEGGEGTDNAKVSKTACSDTT